MSRYALSFDLAESPKDIRGLERFLMTHRGGYAQEKYEQWVAETCIPGIESDNRRALIWRQAGSVVGDAVLVPRGDNYITLKHFRVEAGSLAGRGMGEFMMKQVFPEAASMLHDKGLITSDADSICIDLDTTAGNDAEAFFARFGFEREAEAELYTPGQTEVIMRRTVELV